ncbi:benzoate-CoA ligase family protein [Clostridium beijerinckii]|uniref:Benzoate-CoA ligase family protein n=1 Tax=Clostridium beijerinckii TaxID=1520 RepID=A0AAE5LQ10_CLOBE|nr:benzoate-CoA ligase family protein [Clostridium beijerinckii]ALB45658.1 benzoate-CoA ligase [Clostridium beijerinckii NRRL B-598]NSB14171.1 benzoate-CoA ligase family protein [Clostridium beijerinckii]OOM30523.1 4-hydroxybenzoate--CoA/benzoate--CoA ligase [Clostridium beijerinckii]
MKDIYSSIPEKFNISEYLFRECNIEKGRGKKAAFYFKDIKYTYEEVDKYCCKYGNLFLNMGLQMEQRIAILLPDQPAYIFSFFGAIRAGIVAVLINTRLKIEDIKYIIEDSRIQLLLTDKNWKERLGNIKTPWLKNIIIIDDDSQENKFDNIIESCSETLETAQTTRDDIAFWMYTSGSSGRPKGVMHLQHDMYICIELFSKGLMKMTENDVMYSIAKLPFAYGLANSTYLTFGVGATSILSDSNSAFDIVENVKKYKPTLFFAVPVIFASLLHIVDVEPLDTSSIRIMYTSGEVLPKSLWYKWKERFGIELVQGMGTTEFLNGFLSDIPGNVRPGSTGLPIEGYEVKVVDENNNPVKPGVVGDLLVSGESLMCGYWNRHNETQKVLFGNSMKTGDKFYQDEDGYFYYVGRCIDLFKVNGLWVKATEIEDVLTRNPKIYQVAIDDEISEEELTKIVAYVVLQPSVEPNEELTREFKRFMKSNIEHFKCPAEYRYVDEIPKGPTGKIDRRVLKGFKEKYKK